MKPITEYQDYRRYMQDFYEEKKKSGFTWREFSKGAGFASPSYLKLVCEGKSSLSRVGLPREAFVDAALRLQICDAGLFQSLRRLPCADGEHRRVSADTVHLVSRHQAKLDELLLELTHLEAAVAGAETDEKERTFS